LSAEHHPALAHHFDSLEQQHGATSLGVWFFLASEVLIFGALFLGYTIYFWKFPDEWRAASSHLNAVLGGLNTAVLLGSSLTMALAVRAGQLGDRRQIVLYLALTLALGTAFLGVKAAEWTHDYHLGLVPNLGFLPEPWREQGVNPYRVQLFFAIYFSMTGLHALHMIAGLAVIGWLIWLAHKGRFSAEYNSPVELTGLYWHFVDVVWIFLFPLFYLVGGARH
jgi:cytochrome c oxidase subunit III